MIERIKSFYSKQYTGHLNKQQCVNKSVDTKIHMGGTLKGAIPMVNNRKS